MWPMLLDMTKIECRRDLRKLELDAYSIIVTTFRAQGNLNPRKIRILKDLEIALKISSDRHKAELRRAVNDERLYTIAKRLSRGECVSSGWLEQSRRLIPLLPRLQHNSNTSKSTYYRILADHILNTSQKILKLYPEPDNTKFVESDFDESLPAKNRTSNKLLIRKRHKKTNSLLENSQNNSESSEVKQVYKIAKKDEDMLYLTNGYAVSSKCVEVENIKPSEFVKKTDIYEKNNIENSSSFLKYLIQKYRNQNQDATNKKESSLPKSPIHSPIQETVISHPLPSIEHNSKKSNETNKTGSTNTSTSNKNSKLISQIIEANATKAVQKQQNSTQSVSPPNRNVSIKNNNSSSNQQIVLQQLKPMAHAYPIQSDLVPTQLISNSNIILDSNTDKANTEQANNLNKFKNPNNKKNSDSAGIDSINNSIAFNNNSQILSTSNNIKPPTAIKISSAQILRLNSPSPATLISPTSVSSIASNNTTQNSQATQSNNSTSTIVKLTAQPQMNINNFNKTQLNNNSNPSNNPNSITTSQANGSVGSNNSSYQLYNTNTQQLKHLVQLPKSAQKLIILPTSNNSPQTKQNILINTNSLTTPLQTPIVTPLMLENGDLNNQNSNINNQLRIVSSLNPNNSSITNSNTMSTNQINNLNGLHPSAVQKLILYKAGNSTSSKSGNIAVENNSCLNSTTGNSAIMNNSNNENNNNNIYVNNNSSNNGNNINKSLKIISTTPIIANQIISTNNASSIVNNNLPNTSTNSSNVSNVSNLINKPIVFNVSSGLKKNNLMNKFNNTQVNSQLPLPNTNISSVSLENNNFSSKISENEALKSTNEINIIKDNHEDKNESIHSSQKLQKIETMSIHTPRLIPSTLCASEKSVIYPDQIENANVNDSDCLNNKRKRSMNMESLYETYLEYIQEVLESINPDKSNEEQKFEMRLLCEKIKEKLEKQLYESMDALNIDLDKIKEMNSELNIGSTTMLPLCPQNLQTNVFQPQIHCFKFDDDLQKIDNDLESNSNNSNKKIRLLNYNAFENTSLNEQKSENLIKDREGLTDK